MRFVKLLCVELSRQPQYSTFQNKRFLNYMWTLIFLLIVALQCSTSIIVKTHSYAYQLLNCPAWTKVTTCFLGIRNMWNFISHGSRRENLNWAIVYLTCMIWKETQNKTLLFSAKWIAQKHIHNNWYCHGSSLAYMCPTHVSISSYLNWITSLIIGACPSISRRRLLTYCTFQHSNLCIL